MRRTHVELIVCGAAMVAVACSGGSHPNATGFVDASTGSPSVIDASFPMDGASDGSGGGSDGSSSSSGSIGSIGCRQRRRQRRRRWRRCRLQALSGGQPVLHRPALERLRHLLLAPVRRLLRDRSERFVRQRRFVRQQRGVLRVAWLGRVRPVLPDQLYQLLPGQRWGRRRRR